MHVDAGFGHHLTLHPVVAFLGVQQTDLATVFVDDELAAQRVVVGSLDGTQIAQSVFEFAHLSRLADGEGEIALAGVGLDRRDRNHEQA